MKSMCQEARRNSPSVAVRSPTSSCIFTTSRIASSSTARSSSSSSRPSACAARASSSRCGRSRLPTWSARNGGVSLMLNRSPPDQLVQVGLLLDEAVLLAELRQLLDGVLRQLRLPARQVDLRRGLLGDLRVLGEHLADRVRVLLRVLQRLLHRGLEAVDELRVGADQLLRREV